MTNLSEKEKAVSKWISLEFTDKQIAKKLGVCERSVRYYIRSACEKVGAETRVGLAVAYTKSNSELKQDSFE